MIESMLGINYGTIVTEVVYKKGEPVTTKQVMISSIATPDRKTLLDNIFVQLQRLQTEDVIEFKIYANKLTREPARIELCSQTRLV